MKSGLSVFILLVFVSMAVFGAFSISHEGMCVLDCLAQAQYTLHQEIYTVKISNESSFLKPQSFKGFSVFVLDRIVVPI